MNYKNKRWRTLRLKRLREDKFECQECKRFGKGIEADTVHHMLPAEHYPEYQYNILNLVSLCKDCHNNMHNRESRELTSQGWELAERRLRGTELKK